MRSALKQARSVEDTIDLHPFDEITEEIKSLLKDAQLDADATESAGSTAAVAAEDKHSIAKAFIGVDDTTKLSILTGLSDDDDTKIRIAEEKARRLVMEGAKIEPEPATSKMLATMLQESPVGQMLESSDGYCLIIYSSNQSGESTSSPWSRRVSLQTPSLKKLVNGVQRSRDDESRIHKNDLYCFCDGGKHGHDASLTQSITDSEGKAVQKQKRTLFMVFREDAIEGRKDNPRGCALLHQMEQIHFVTASAMRVKKTARKHGSGTTAGDAVQGLSLPENQWLMTFKDKKQAYGPHKRILPSGRDDEGSSEPTATPKARKDDDLEPFQLLDGWP
jgi:hypothetical protein